MSMLTPLPATELALRDTLITRAKGTVFDDLCRMYGLARPAFIDEKYWREALRAVLYGPRGTRGNLHVFLEEALRQYTVTYHCSVAPANPQRLTYLSGGTAGGFEAADVNRLLRITYSRGSFLVRSVGPSFVGGPAVSPFLELCSVSTGYWSGVSFGTSEDVLVELLPFVWADTDAEFYLWADIGTFTPPTYMQPQVRWAAKQVLGVAAPSYPYPGDALDHPGWEYSAALLIDPSVSNYIVTAETAGTWRNLIVNADNDGTPARGDSYVVLLEKKVAGVWGATALTCTLAAALKTASDMANSVVLVEGDEVRLKVTPGAAVTQPAYWFRASVYIDRPVGEPNGGDLMENAWALEDPAGGPWPLYLGEALDTELLRAIWALLAAGVVLRGQPAVFDDLNGLP